MEIHEDDRVRIKREMRNRLNKCIRNLLEMKDVLLKYEESKHCYKEAKDKISEARRLVDAFWDSPKDADSAEEEKRVNRALENAEQYLRVLHDFISIMQTKERNMREAIGRINKKLRGKEDNNEDDENGDEWVHILHLSDLHFGMYIGKENKEQNEKRVFDVIESKLFDFFKNYVEDGKRIDVIAITGDISYHGEKEEYDQFKRWLKKLCGKKLLNVDIRDHVVMCPGNHDKHHDKMSEYRRIVDSGGKNGSEEALAIDKIRDRQNQFAQFNEVCEELKIKPLKNFKTDESKRAISYVMGIRKIEGINFAVLNSAWNSFPRSAGFGPDHGRLFLGREPVYFLFQETHVPEEGTTVMLFHHPLAWLHETEIRTYEEGQDDPSSALVRQHADIILNGHVHGGIEPPDILANKTVVFGGGALYADDSRLRQFEIISVNTKRHYCRQKVVCFNSQTRPGHPVGWEMLDEKYPPRIYYGIYRDVQDLILRYGLGELRAEEASQIALASLGAIGRKIFDTVFERTRDYQILQIIEEDVYLKELVSNLLEKSADKTKELTKDSGEGEK